MSVPAGTHRARGWRSRVAKRLPRRVRDALDRGRRAVLMQLPTAVRLPAVSVELRGWLPCWAFRVIAVAVAIGTGSLVIRSGFGWTVVSVLVGVILIRPGAPGPQVLAVVLGFSLLQQSAQVWGARGPLVLLGTHLCVALCVLLGATSWAAKVQLAVFWPAGLRFAVIQLVAQLTGVLGALLAGRRLDWPWVPVTAALAALLVAYLWLPRLGRRVEPPPGRPTTASRGTGSIDPMARRWGDE